MWNNCCFRPQTKLIGGFAFYECLPHVRLVFYMLRCSKGCFSLKCLAFWCKQMNYRPSSQRCWSATDDHEGSPYIYMYHRNGLQILERRTSGWCLISYVLWSRLYEHCCHLYSHVSRQYITVNLQYHAVCIQHCYMHRFLMFLSFVSSQMLPTFWDPNPLVTWPSGIIIRQRSAVEGTRKSLFGREHLLDRRNAVLKDKAGTGQRRPELGNFW